MVNQKIRPASRIGWMPVEIEKFGWTVVVFDSTEPDLAIALEPKGTNPRAYATAEDARVAAVLALRDLAKRIARGEE